MSSLWWDTKCRLNGGREEAGVGKQRGHEAHTTEVSEDKGMPIGGQQYPGH